jgi:hypothetical protein
MHTEQHYKPSELAKRWGFHADKVRIWFANEPGVLVEDRPEKMHKRGYKSMRIPDSVAARVYAKHVTK